MSWLHKQISGRQSNCLRFCESNITPFRCPCQGPPANGFVSNSFYRGLTPTEFFFHTMAGCERTRGHCRGDHRDRIYAIKTDESSRRSCHPIRWNRKTKQWGSRSIHIWRRFLWSDQIEVMFRNFFKEKNSFSWLLMSAQFKHLSFSLCRL